MIAFVEGRLIESGPDAVIAVGGGLGLDVQLSALGASQLPPIGETVRLWTHLAVREDAWSLFGFVTVEEREMFRLLITVSGVGPKVALGMLSKASPAAIAGYLRTGDEKSLTALPGIGKKSAARLVVELGQRVPAAAVAAAGGTAPLAGADTALGEALAVLAAMGLAPARGEAALLEVRRRSPELAENTESWVRAALRVI